MDGPKPKCRWYRPTPGRVIVGLLVAECLLWLSDQLGGWHKGYAVLTSIGVAAIQELQRKLPACEILH